ncbi:MAG: hypothetical protein ACFBSG_05120 [Leptolyngbyaceae cyanobacterium]
MLRAWRFVLENSEFITPEQVMQAAEISHDMAASFLQTWLEAGILRRAPRYPGYVYYRAKQWQEQPLAQQLNQYLTADR